MLGSNASNAKAGGASSHNHTTVPVVVWTLQERSITERTAAADNDSNNPTASSNNWKYNLMYYEFLDDTARWTHLDQLLLQLCDPITSSSNENSDDDDDDNNNNNNNDPFFADLPSIHVGTSENLEKLLKRSNNNNNNNNGVSDTASIMSQVSTQTSATTATAAATASALRTQKLINSLQTFLDDRLFSTGDNDHESLQRRLSSTHVHLCVPCDSYKVESSISQLLVQDETTQLAVRGNIQLSQPLIKQGLALWLQSQGLYGTTNTSGSMMMFEGSLKIHSGILTSHLVMDSTAAQAIHLFPPSNDGVASVVGGNKHTNSLYGLLSKPCKTTMGKKLLHLWLRQPLVDLEQIQQRQDVVTQLLGIAKDSIRDGLAPFSTNGAGSLLKLGPALAKYRGVNGEKDDDGEDGTSAAAATRIVDTKKPLETLYHLYILASRHLPNLLDCMDCIKGGDDDGQESVSHPFYVTCTNNSNNWRLN